MAENSYDKFFKDFKNDTLVDCKNHSQQKIKELLDKIQNATQEELIGLCDWILRQASVHEFNRSKRKGKGSEKWKL